MRLALGLSYLGQAYDGWQSQPSGNTVQDHLELALARFCGQPVSTVCAGRTDSGVHGLQQVVHFDTELSRDPFSWVRGTNRFLPADIAVQWAHPVPDAFHSRASARSRRYAYILLESPVRPSVEAGRVGWVFRPLDLGALRAGAQHLLGEHDFSAFRASSCQALSPVKHLMRIEIERRKFRPHITLARFPGGAETGHHLAQFMASHSTFRAGPWLADHFALYSSRAGGNGRIYTEEAAYDLGF